MRTALRSARYVVAVLLGVFALLFAWDAVYGFLHGVDIDPADRCLPGEAGHCFSRVRGVTVEAGRFYDLKVRYDDGRRTTGLFLPDAEPERGIPVWLETWDGEVVSVYDSSTETRYRTRDWPLRWEWGDIVLASAFSGFAVVCWPRRKRRLESAVTPQASEAQQ